MPSTKIEVGFNRIARIQGLDDFARLLFPGNKNHQKVFILMFVEMKHAEGQFLGSLSHLPREHGISARTLETVRAKCRRLGLIDHVCRFNGRHGYREGWVFSNRFERSLDQLAQKWKTLLTTNAANQKRKEMACAEYL